MKITKHIYLQLILCVLILLIQHSSFSQILKTETFLPLPSGPYKIGTKEIYLTDSSRHEKYSWGKKYRKMSVKIWYPSDYTPELGYDCYMATYSTKIIFDIFKPLGVKKSFLDSTRHFKTHSVCNAPISTKQEKFPVIIFSSGYYFGIPDLNSCIMENLASNGYIVCSLTHPYEQPYVAFPDGKKIYLKKGKTRLAFLQLLIADWVRPKDKSTVEKREAITRNTLKRLKKFDKALKLWVDDSEFLVKTLIENCAKNDTFFCKIDTSRIGALGHSFGGAVAGQLCKNDPRVKAGINIDCFQFGNVIDNPLTSPFMLIESSTYIDWNIGNEIIYSKSNADFYKLSILNSSHFIFSDASVIPFSNPKNVTDFNGKANGRKTIDATNHFVLHFFDYYLNNDSESKKLLYNKFSNSEMIFDYKLKQ